MISKCNEVGMCIHKGKGKWAFHFTKKLIADLRSLAKADCTFSHALDQGFICARLTFTEKAKEGAPAPAPTSCGTPGLGGRPGACAAVLCLVSQGEGSRSQGECSISQGESTTRSRRPAR